jgi:hypothetical protein
VHPEDLSSPRAWPHDPSSPHGWVHSTDKVHKLKVSRLFLVHQTHHGDIRLVRVLLCQLASPARLVRACSWTAPITPQRRSNEAAHLEIAPPYSTC